MTEVFVLGHFNTGKNSDILRLICVPVHSLSAIRGYHQLEDLIMNSTGTSIVDAFQGQLIEVGYTAAQSVTVMVVPISYS